MLKLKYSVLCIISFSLFACSSSQESIQESQKKEPEVLVFQDTLQPDSVKTDTTKMAEIVPEPVKSEEPVPSIQFIAKYYIQVGVFSTSDRARVFIDENQRNIPYLLNITVRESDKKYIVRLKPFESREEAEKVKNSIRQNPVFKDAFIVTID